MNSQSKIFDKDDKIYFDTHMNDVKYVIFDKLQNISDDEKHRLLSLDIISEGSTFMDDTRGRLERSEELKNFMLNRIYELLAAYYLQFHGRYPEEERYDRFETLKRFILHIEVVRKMLLEDEPRGTGQRRLQVHPWNAERNIRGFFNAIFPTFADNEETFQSYTRMSKRQFWFLLDAVRHKLEGPSNSRDAVISAPEKLLLTLRYLATGETFESLGFAYMMEAWTVEGIVKETCIAIWDQFHSLYLNFPVKHLEQESDKWAALHKMPHCLGAIGSKHIKIEKPANSEREYYNYKNFYSIVLMAVCDADANFIFATVGASGSNSNQDVWKHSALERAIVFEHLKFPPSKHLPNSNVLYNYFYIGDRSLALSNHFLKTYTNQNLSPAQEHFNRIITAGRSTIERSFELLTNRFRLLRREIDAQPQTVTKIVKAALILHNYIRKTSDENTPDIDDVVIDAEENVRACSGRPPVEASQNRDVYMNYLWNIENQ